MRDEHDVPPGHQGMTRFGTKYQHWETLDAYNDLRRGFPWNDMNIQWDPDKYRTPQNMFGMKSGLDPSPEIQTFAPAGMFGQLLQGKARGDEMSTLPFRRQYNTNL